ncbi:MAG TPA: ATP-binding cassette domain-containing protein [Anaeromyxobacteraceae bacterium]|nr:ATP-binding cassette domain-containing protein [Anaeromyxobacteraceae bacterium]
MTPALEISGLSLDDRDGRPLVRKFDLLLAPGERLVVAGPVEATSGILRAAMGLDAPAAGTVRLLGRDAATLPREEAEALFARIGYSPRVGALLSNLPLRDNLLLPLRYHRRLGSAEVPEAALRAADRFGLGELPAAIPPIASVLTRRRVILARAILLDPVLLVVDDPTEDLDAGAADEIADRLGKAAGALGAAVLAASNDFRVGAALGARTLLLASTATA